jgi:hypothetical protein
VRPAPQVPAGRGPLAYVLTFVVATIAVLTGCGGSDDRGGTVAFRPGRSLAPASQRSLDAVSGAAAAVPAGLADSDLMGSMTTPWHDFADRATKRRFGREIAAARGAARRYLDAAHPAMLLYDGEGTDAHLLGLSYYTHAVGSPPSGFAGDNDRWHRHFGACYSGGFIIGENVGSADECAVRCQARVTGAISAPVGDQAEIPEMNRYLRSHPGPRVIPSTCRLVPGDDVWMLHAWVAPGHADPDGLFSTMNPRVRHCVGTCRPT